ncbi:hypothetical protein [Paralcaligenes ureilyticus]|uniref:Uncharacterized protein n=1 Tax=Paralcaligenes ureilyticus TaxID=627131 RepID=A0A4R3M512_9BURK|nr:hypothetical protein [Paralcaligenes ureilyticus]TCT06295.1 hypothetical protein EDC26_10831 [Paralcaligenes ureilyticus]
MNNRLDFQRFGSHKGCRYINDDFVKINHTSVVAGRGGAGDSGTPPRSRSCAREVMAQP